MNLSQLLNKLDIAWEAFNTSYTGLTDAELEEPGVTGDWSVRDIIVHVTWWEEEALRHLPVILVGGRPPRYSITYGGIDAFNAQMTELKRGLPLHEVLQLRDDTHHRLVEYIQQAPADQYAKETRFRRRLRLDTYSHYPEHTEAIWKWREKRSTR